MPTFKHPCPHCGAYINRDVVACPACGRADPFAPGRCPTCKAPIDDLSWVACPKCGTSLIEAPAQATAPTSAGSAPAAAADSSGPGHAGAARCTGCGAPLATGARFCRECGTAGAG